MNAPAVWTPRGLRKKVGERVDVLGDGQGEGKALLKKGPGRQVADLELRVVKARLVVAAKRVKASKTDGLRVDPRSSQDCAEHGCPQSETGLECDAEATLCV